MDDKNKRTALEKIKDTIAKCMVNLPRYVTLLISISPASKGPIHNYATKLVTYLRNLAPNLEIQSSSYINGKSTVRLLTEAKDALIILTAPPTITIDNKIFLFRTYTPGFYKTSIHGLPEVLLSNPDFMDAILQSIGGSTEPILQGRTRIPITEEESNTFIALFKTKPECFDEENRISLEVNNLPITLVLTSQPPTKPAYKQWSFNKPLANNLPTTREGRKAAGPPPTNFLSQHFSAPNVKPMRQFRTFKDMCNKNLEKPRPKRSRSSSSPRKLKEPEAKEYTKNVYDMDEEKNNTPNTQQKNMQTQLQLLPSPPSTSNDATTACSPVDDPQITLDDSDSNMEL